VYDELRQNTYTEPQQELEFQSCRTILTSAWRRAEMCVCVSVCACVGREVVYLLEPRPQ